MLVSVLFVAAVVIVLGLFSLVVLFLLLCIELTHLPLPPPNSKLALLRRCLSASTCSVLMLQASKCNFELEGCTGEESQNLSFVIAGAVVRKRPLGPCFEDHIWAGLAGQIWRPLKYVKRVVVTACCCTCVFVARK